MTGPVVAVDLGATQVAAALEEPPGAAGGAGPFEPVDLPGADGPVEPAAVFAPADGTALCVGREARRRAAADPSRYEPTPRRRADDVELLLGTRVVGVAEAWGAVLADVLHRAGPRLRGERPRTLVLTHPAGWDSGRLELLRRAGSGLAESLRLVPEPVAAAAHARWMRPRGADTRAPLAVLDLGATAASAAVLEPRGERAGALEVVAHRADEAFGGDDADELLLAHLLAGLAGDTDADRVREVAAGATLGDRRHRQVLVDDVRAAKERLSEAEQAPVVLPGRFVAAWLSRAELEDVLRPALRGVVGLLADTVAAAGTTPERLAGVWLTGGGARLPLLGALVHRELGVPATVAPEPRTVVARGALVVAREGDRADGHVDSAGPVAGAPGGLGVLAAAARGDDDELGPGTRRETPVPGAAVGAPSGSFPAARGPSSGGRSPTGPFAVPRVGGPAPGGATGPVPAARASGPFPVATPRTGPFPAAGPASGPFPVAAPASGPYPAAPASGPFPVAAPAPRGPAPARGPFPVDPFAVPPRDPDDTGEILDDSWDGRWGDEDERLDGRDDRRDDLWDARAGGDRDDPWDAARTDRAPAVTPPVRRRPARRRLATAGAVVALVLAAAGLVVGITRGATPGTASGDVVEAWGHRFAVPAGWVRVGGDDAARRVVLRRPEEPRGVDLIAVQSAVLPRDLAADPERARERIAEQYEQARSAGDPVSGLELRASVAGREVTRYRQQVAPGVRLDWLVLQSGGDQVSVGCRHADDGGARAPLPRACEEVVGSLDGAGA